MTGFYTNNYNNTEGCWDYGRYNLKSKLIPKNKYSYPNPTT